jgi:glycosyltransferase involved in cell wall biosynthesis
MISGRDFVVFSDNWDGPGHGLPTSAIHLFRRLAARNRVFWFNTLSRLPRPNQGDVSKVAQALGSWVKGRRTRPAPADVTVGVHVGSPLMVPWFKPVVRRFNGAAMRRTYDRLRQSHGIDNPVVVTTAPYGADHVAAVDGGTKVYYCVDEFLDYPGVNHRDMAAMESDLLGAIDALVVTSRDLERKRRGDCPMLRLPHGVDFDHFHGAVVRAEREPRMEGFRRPIVGFFGVISEWVDQGVIARLSEQFRDASFVILGRADVDLRPLAGRPNVHYLGPVPYRELPRYARYFDVGLIPFVLNDLTRAVFPLKLFEYFALGLPVLATRLPDLEAVEGPIRLALSDDEFQKGLAELLGHNPELTAEAAFAAARANTWDSRVEQLSRFLEGLTPLHIEQAEAARARP